MAPSRPSALGRWEVVAKIAGGGLSTIYLGRNRDEASHPPVALKIVKNELEADGRIANRFGDEARLLPRLVHPNIVRTLEVGEADGRQFIVMELMTGMNLAAVTDACAARGLRVHADIVAHVAAKVAEALAFAHELDDGTGAPLALIHRDVNPSNIFLTFDGEVKLFDFGLAKSTDAREQTSPGMVVGKLPYIAPEQIMQLPFDQRSDLFALGTTMWETLTSKRLFKRDTDADTVNAVQFGPIPDVRASAPDTPGELWSVVRKALERNRDNRYPNARALLADLGGFVATRDSRAIPSRIAQLLEQLFADEKRRQRGWRKPAIRPMR
jgi:serine/threonine-protein kinase